MLLLSSCIPAPAQSVSRTMNPGDSLTVNLKFGSLPVSKGELTAQQAFSTVLLNSAQTNQVLAASINKLTSTVEEGMQVAKLTKADVVAKQMGVSKDVLNKAFKRNHTIMLISLIPVLIFALWAMYTFFLKKGIDTWNVISGTALIGVYTVMGSAALYAILSLSINSKYFVIKELMSSLF
jgi:hypothetical protein